MISHSPRQNCHLYVALSGHGFGHLAQVAPVLNEWRRRWSQARLTVQSALPEAVLRQRIVGKFAVVAGAADFGMVMVDALAATLLNWTERTLGVQPAAAA